MRGPPPRSRRAGWLVSGGVLIVWLGCSLLIFVRAVQAETLEAEKADMEKRELRMANELLRKKNAELLETLRKSGAVANQTALSMAMKSDSRSGLVADDLEARSSSEWKGFLLNALRSLDEADQQIRLLQKRLQLLVYASKETVTPKGKEGRRRGTLLEEEIRLSEKLLSGAHDSPVSAFLPSVEMISLKNAKVVGVQFELGVAALGVGSKNGARVGMPFLVLRGKTVVAVLTLAEVRENISLALIEQMDPDKPIKVGDAAELRKV